MSAELLNAPAPEVKDVAEEFRRLAEWWDRETAVVSNLNVSFKHPAYQAIIALGPPVIPILLHELETNPHWWFRALRELTGANVVPRDDAGNLPRMAAAWIKWGREHGHLEGARADADIRPNVIVDRS
jgi:hypothetical protein